MTRATRALREEHRWIRLLLDCLEVLVATFRTTGRFDSRAAAELQILFEHFVDEQHQNKEEAALFPKLLECVRGLQEDHAREREHLERMRFSLFNAALGDPAGREEFVGDALSYLALQRQHMAREDQALLPLAEELFDAEDDDDVLAEFRRLEAEGYSGDEVATRVQDLCAQLGVAFASAPEPDEVAATHAR